MDRGGRKPAFALLLLLAACDGSARAPEGLPDITIDASAPDSRQDKDRTPVFPDAGAGDAVAQGPDEVPPVPGRFVERVVFSGLNKPVAVRFSRDGQAFVAEKAGVIKRFASLGASAATVLVDLSAEVHSYGDRGLLDLVLDPDFPAQPYLYALYTLDGRVGDSLAAGSVPRYRDACPDPKGAGCIVAARLVRLTVSDDPLATRDSQIILIENWAQQFSSHSIGGLAFGPDGYLYVAAGDGASFEHVDYGNLGGNPLAEPPDPASSRQSPPSAQGGALRAQVVDMPAANSAATSTAYAGKVIRLDARHALPAGDPAALESPPQIIASGLRNPYRIAVRPGTAELWLADVGWNTWEEIDRIADITDPTRTISAATPRNPLTNFGWPCYEGPLPQPGYEAAGLRLCSEMFARPTAHTAPAYTYHHWGEVVAGDGCGVGGSSISGLTFYEKGGYPARFEGAVFFTDYTRQCIWSAPLGRDGSLDPAKIELFASGVSKPVQLVIGPGNDLYYVDLEGTVRRFEYSTSNHAPTAVLTASPRWGQLPLTVKLDASGSRDPDTAETLSFAWDLDGDGDFDDGAGANITRSFPAGSAPGGVSIGVEVTDARGGSARQYLKVWPGLEPPAPFIESAEPATWKVGDVVSFSGYANDAAGNPLPASALTWSIIVLHCPAACHEHPMMEMAGVHGGVFEAPDHDYPMRLLLRLAAVDSDGLRATVDRELFPATSLVTVDSVPSGLLLAFNGTTELTPFERTVIRGSHNSLSAPSQVMGNVGQRFVAWSDGEEQDHIVTPDELEARYVASFEAHPLAQREAEASLVLTHGSQEPSSDGDPRELIRDGVRPDVSYPGTDAQLVTSHTPPALGEDAYVGYQFPAVMSFTRMVFQEGMHFEDGGFFDSLRVEVRIDGAWRTVPGLRIQPAYTGSNAVPWETFVLDFEPTRGDAVRLIGRPGGPGRFVSVAELEVWAEALPVKVP